MKRTTDISNMAKTFESMAQKKHWGDSDPSRHEPWETENAKVPVAATISALKHAAKLTMKAAEELERGNDAKARATASIAFETLKDMLDRLE